MQLAVVLSHKHIASMNGIIQSIIIMNCDLERFRFSID